MEKNEKSDLATIKKDPAHPSPSIKAIFVATKISSLIFFLFINCSYISFSYFFLLLL